MHAASITADQMPINIIALGSQPPGFGVVPHPSRLHPTDLDLLPPHRFQQRSFVATRRFADHTHPGHLAQSLHQRRDPLGGVRHRRLRPSFNHILQSRLGHIQADVTHRFGPLSLVIRVHDSISGSSLARNKTATHCFVPSFTPCNPSVCRSCRTGPRPVAPCALAGCSKPSVFYRTWQPSLGRIPPTNSSSPFSEPAQGSLPLAVLSHRPRHTSNPAGSRRVRQPPPRRTSRTC